MRIAIVGSGQLAQMLALAGLPMGIEFSFIVDKPDADIRCIEGLGKIVHSHKATSPEALYQALGMPDCITVEKEQLDVSLLESLAQFCPVRPNIEAVRTCQNRQREKLLLESLGIPSSPHFFLASKGDAQAAADAVTYPVVLKSCEEGYDGKNQFIVHTAQELLSIVSQEDITPCIAEQWLNFDKEVSIVGARATDGSMSFYSLAENIHHKGILTRSIAPAKALSAQQSQTAENYLSQIMEKLDYVGVMAVECFLLGEELLVNELAPRVHNSGHWTQLGARTCQFENHIRAIAGLKLGSSENIGVAGMLNLIGTKQAPLELADKLSSVHWYRKSPRPGRKLGHINFVGKDWAEVNKRMDNYLGLVKALSESR